MPSLCESCERADRSCPVYPQDTDACASYWQTTKRGTNPQKTSDDQTAGINAFRGAPTHDGDGNVDRRSAMSFGSGVAEIMNNRHVLHQRNTYQTPDAYERGYRDGFRRAIEHMRNWLDGKRGGGDTEC